MTYPHSLARFVTLILLTLPACSLRADDADTPLTHRLVPGLRSSDLNDTTWARPFHDRVGSGFSPLVCDITSTAEVWSEIKFGGQLRGLTLIDSPAGQRILVNDGNFRLLDASRNILWTSNRVAPILYQGPLRGGDKTYLLLGGRAAITTADANDDQGKTTGPRLLLMDAETGQTEWEYVFDSPRGHAKPAVGDLLPDKPGLEAAIFLSHAEEGCVINFPPAGDPEFIWQKKVVIPGEFDEQYDHGCDIKLDLSQPDQPMIWNVRRFRCRGFDPRTGDMLSTLSYDIGGAHRRNYGPWDLGVGHDGRPMICVVANRVQTHVHGIELARSGENRLAWQHYYGEVHKESPGVVVEPLAIADLDGDGVTEVAYTVRDHAQDLRTFVRVRDCETGQIEVEIPDCWGVAAVQNVGSDGSNCLLVLPDAAGRMPRQGDIKVYAFDSPNSVQQIGEISNAKPWGPATVTHDGHQELLVHQSADDTHKTLACYDIKNGQLQKSRETSAPGLLQSPLQSELTRPNDEPIYLTANSSGQLQARTWSGDLAWELPLAGRYTASISAADWDRDGKAELFVTTPYDTLNVYSVGSTGEAVEVFQTEYLSTTEYSPTIIHDESDQPLLIAPQAGPDGNLALNVMNANGNSSIMELPIPAVVCNSITINAGPYLPGGELGIAVAVSDVASAQQGVYLLEWKTGKVLWHRDRYQDGNIAMPYTMRGVPAGYDFDGDGAEEVIMDLLSYMAFVRGSDGSFAYVLPSSNIRTNDSMYAGKLYNSFTPLFEAPSDSKAHWLVTAGIGSIGLMKPDPREGNWREELMYDMPKRLGMIDVDGDGLLEVGYAAASRDRFICRNAWTGEIEWDVKLPYPINDPVISADVDGDGKGEFLVNRFCIGTNDEGRGEIRFELPNPLGYGLIADFDGDGKGEIACAHPGGISILKAKTK